MPSAPEVITVPTHTDEVACDGGNGALGHPMVYYSFDGAPQVRCGYCDRLFTKGALPAGNGHHGNQGHLDK